MPLPDITDHELVALRVLWEQKNCPGRAIRDRLKLEGDTKTQVAFYRMMARLEKAGYVTGVYDDRNVEGFTLKQRLYTITANGKKAFQSKLSFVASQIPDVNKRSRLKRRVAKV